MIRAALVAAVLLATPAFADDIVKGSIVKVEHEEIYVNIGAKQGIGDGAALRIKRAINLKHPVTRAAINDWIPIASATVTQSGTGLSRAVIGQLIDRVKIGDVVEALVETQSTPDTNEPAPPRPNEPPPPPVDPQTAAVLAAFAGQAGLTLDARIATWERYLSTNKSSPFAPAIQQDILQLQALREQMKSPDPGATEIVEQLEHDAPTTADAGEPIPLVFLLAVPDRVASAYLHYRTRGRRTFTRMLLVREHDIYLRGSIPAEVVKAPGVDYFVEISAPNGASGLAFRTPADPLRITVKPPPIVDHFDEKQRGRSTVTMSAEYLDFATFDKRDGDRRDRMYNARLDVGYRIDSIIRRVGVGYGAMGGQGGFRNFTWDPAASPIPESGYHYGYADVEAGKPDLAIGGKLIAGVGKEGFGMGVEGRGRIGAWDDTNLTITAQNIPDVGYATDVRLGTRPTDDLLLGLAVGATDQPNTGHAAAKLTTEFQWIGNEHVSVLVRGSWQGRSSIHGGIGGGAELGFTW